MMSNGKLGEVLGESHGVDVSTRKRVKFAGDELEDIAGGAGERSSKQGRSQENKCVGEEEDESGAVENDRTASEIICIIEDRIGE